MITQRLLSFDALKSETFDLLVIGGGITGAGIALDAATRGMKVALVEKGDFASGTSSKSTKLIHGGLRYLKQFEIGLVQEVGRERAIVHQLAPHLVKAEKMLLPIVEGGTFGKLSTSLGLKVYDLLAGVKGNDRRRMLTRPETLAVEPLLRKQGLLGGGLYAEYRTDDARLTLELVKTAIRHGAHCLNYVEVKHFNYENGKITEAVCQDQNGGVAFPVSAKQFVSAAGPWVDGLRKKDGKLKGKRVFLSKGVHIVVAHERMPLRHSVYFDVPDGRMLFAIPRQRATYLGTTDTAFEGDPDHVFADAKDVEYLLAGANAMFPGLDLTKKEVESTWAGLRPLIFEEGKSPGEMSRKNELFVSESGLISIAGGKLTGYRKMAEKVVGLVSKKLTAQNGKTYGPCKTASVPLGVRPFASAAEAAGFQDAISKKTGPMGLPGHYPAYLVENYGRSAEDILRHAMQQPTPPVQAILKAELAHCLENELTVKPADFFERRTGRLYFDFPSVQQHLDFVLGQFQLHFNWDAVRLENEKKEITTLMENLRRF